MDRSISSSSCTIKARDGLHSDAQSFFTLVSQTNLDFYIMNYHYSPLCSLICSHMTFASDGDSDITITFCFSSLFSSFSLLLSHCEDLQFASLNIMVDLPLRVLTFSLNLCTCMQQLPLVCYTVRYSNILPFTCSLSFYATILPWVARTGNVPSTSQWAK